MVTDIAECYEKIEKGHAESVCIDAEVFIKFNALWDKPEQA